MRAGPCSASPRGRLLTADNLTRVDSDDSAFLLLESEPTGHVETIRQTGSLSLARVVVARPCFTSMRGNTKDLRDVRLGNAEPERLSNRKRCQGFRKFRTIRPAAVRISELRRDCSYAMLRTAHLAIRDQPNALTPLQRLKVKAHPIDTFPRIALMLDRYSTSFCRYFSQRSRSKEDLSPPH